MILEAKYSPLHKSIDSEFNNLVSNITDSLLSHGFSDIIAERIATSGIKKLFNSWFQPLMLIPSSVHLVPKNEEWAVLSDFGKELVLLTDNYGHALSEARQFAKRNKIRLVIHSSDGWAKDTESFQVNRPYFAEVGI